MADSDPWEMVDEFGANANTKITFRNGPTLKLPLGAVKELASHIHDAVQFGKNSAQPIGTDAGEEITVSIHNKTVAIQVWSPDSHTQSVDLTRTQAKSLIKDLEGFVAIAA